MKTVYLLKIEDKEGGGDEYTIVYATREGAEADLQQRAAICESDNEWLDEGDNRERYEMAGDYDRDANSFYLVDTLQLTIEETTVLA